MSNLRLCFTDTETSGIADTIDEALKLDRQVIEYAFILWDDGDRKKTLVRKVMPTGDAIADAKHCASQGWNHFAPNDWLVPSGNPREYVAASPWCEADCENVADFLDGETMAGSNPGFDLTMYKAEFARLGFLDDFPRLATHRKLDVGQLAWPLWSAGLVERTGLEPLAKFLGVPHKAHTALGDVEACIDCFERLVEEFIFHPRRLRDMLTGIAETSPRAGNGNVRTLLDEVGKGL